MHVQSRSGVLLAIVVAQAAVGYTQYFTGVPPLLVGIHVAGATAVWAAVIWFYLGLFLLEGPRRGIDDRPRGHARVGTGMSGHRRHGT